MAIKLPEWLILEVLNEAVYLRWLNRKAIAHVRRDRKRGNTMATPAKYKNAIHDAVISSEGRDKYTGEKLDWSLLSRWNNEEAQLRRRVYKKEFSLLPTVDHVDDGMGEPSFVIASWRTNDAKHDLTFEEFHALCEAVLNHHKSNI